MLFADQFDRLDQKSDSFVNLALLVLNLDSVRKSDEDVCPKPAPILQLVTICSGCDYPKWSRNNIT